MRTKITSLLISSLLLLTLYSIIANGFTVPSEQSYVKLFIPENSSTRYLLFIINDETETRTINITCRGECKIIKLGWQVKEIPPYYYSILPINITLGPGISTYYFEIWGNDKPISKIIVESTLPQNTIMELISTMKKIEDFEKLENKIYEVINESTKDIISVINESSTKTKEEIEKDMRKKLEEMREKIKNEIGTGYAIAENSEKAILFIFGLIFGALLIYFIEYRKNKNSKFEKHFIKESPNLKLGKQNYLK